MRSNVLFVVVLASLLSSCGQKGVKGPPDIDIGFMVFNQELRYSYVHMVPLYEDSGPEYDIPAEKAFKEAMIVTPAKDYAALQKYMEYLEALAKKRCK